MRGLVFIGLVLTLLTGIFIPANATHLVGGEITYRCLGNNRYEVRIDIYQDCLTGLDSARAQDDPAFLGIFTPGGQPVYPREQIPSSADISVPPNFSNSCVNNPPATCLRKVSFVRTYTLPDNGEGYRVIYTRCCRNGSINNLLRPSEVGATIYCDIPPANLAACNSSAVFKNYPPQIICVNNPLVYDHGATDSDGDSLSYEFCDAYPGGTPENPKPWPSSVLPPPLNVYQPNPPSPSFGYRTGFSATRPMGGNPVIQIDPRSGLITGTPNIQGRYVVSVCCHEWRNGVRINTVHREFQFVVTNCSKAVVADIPQLSDEFNTYIVNCKDKTVGFINNSQGGFEYYWDLGVPGATSTDFQPTYTYPDTGTYEVQLVVNRGSTCPDSISRLVKIYPLHEAEYRYEGLPCPNTPIQFTDLSEATYKPVNKWEWSFGDGGTSTDQNPTHAFGSGGDYTVTLISSTIKGCKDTVAKQVKVERFLPFAGNDTIIVKGEIINFRASGGDQYAWTPGDRLNRTDVNNPVGTYPDTGIFRYNVHVSSNAGCEGNDSIQVWVVNQASLFVPNGFTPNGDGLNDYLKMLSVGYSKINYFRVFNRWGEKVFETNEIGKGWDGRYKNQMADVGTYFWTLSVNNRFGKEEMIKGDVTLIR